MRLLVILFALFILPSVAICKDTKSNNVKLHLIERMNSSGFSIIGKWVDPVSFINIGIELDIDNVNKIVVIDENLKNGKCEFNGRGNQLLYFQVDAPIKSKRLMFVVNHPCTSGVNDIANLTIHVSTFDKKYYYNTLSFTSAYGKQPCKVYNTEIMSP